MRTFVGPLELGEVLLVDVSQSKMIEHFVCHVVVCPGPYEDVLGVSIKVAHKSDLLHTLSW
jgi:hypothetical protein